MKHNRLDQPDYMNNEAAIETAERYAREASTPYVVCDAGDGTFFPIHAETALAEYAGCPVVYQTSGGRQ